MCINKLWFMCRKEDKDNSVPPNDEAIELMQIQPSDQPNTSTYVSFIMLQNTFIDENTSLYLKISVAFALHSHYVILGRRKLKIIKVSESVFNIKNVSVH